MKNKTYPYAFVLISIAIYTVFTVIPSLVGILYSFTDWSAYSDKISFVGLQNFKNLFTGTEPYLKFMANTLIFTFFTTLGKTVFGLFFGLIVCDGIVGKNFQRGIIFIPSVLSALIVGIMFKSILHPETGLLNLSLGKMGLEFLRQKWLTNPHIAMASVIGVDIWKGVGYVMTIMLAGIQSISPTYFEAAQIDGAGYWQRLVKIVLPLLRPALTINIVLSVIYGLKVFDLIYAITNGGPGYATEVLATSVYKFFGRGDWSMGTTMSTVLFLAMALIGVIFVRFLEPKGDA